MNTVDTNILYDMGCELGQRDLYMSGNQNSVIILDFAYPYYQAGNYGTILFGAYAFVSTTDIGNAVKNFATRYHNCSDELSRITVAIGTSNCGPEYCSGSEVTYQHGAAWARMVNDVNTFLEYNEYLQIVAIGASDMEVAWNSPTITRDWVNGYDSANYYALYDYGDAQGCPTYRTDGVNGYCDNSWYQEDVWYVSWGSGASKPLPLIYATGGENADQWYSLSAYAYDAHGARMEIKGSVTQYQACQQTGTWCQENHVDNTPAEGYRQLRNALNADPDTAQELLWATDMKWK